MSEINYITPAGMEKLLKEQDYLLKVERPEITKLVNWAASNGDRSENADYQYGKKKLREIDRRLRFLKSRIESARVIDPKAIVSKKIQFGAKVMIEDEEGNERCFTIVGLDEINTEKGLVSWKSPIGGSLIGKEIGDEVEILTPNKTLVFKIVELVYEKIVLE